MSLPRRAVWVTGDPVRLIQVINNLLGNALKYTPRGGTVSVSLEASGGHATVRVRDDGAGISRDLIGALFEPFVQGPQPIDRGAGGLGLGLAMVKGLIELHGGRVSVESAGFNRGSEFIIELPSTTPPAERGMAGPERAPRALRILVIEDNLDSAEVLKQALQLTGHVVALAAAGPEGIELARRFNPEVVLCDLGLPGMSGYSVAEAFRSDASLREIFLVALSGYTQPAAIQSARQAGFNRHVAKPPDLNLLLSMLAEVPVAPAARSAPDEILH
jgi:CheY-like chemotaxis protein